MFAADWPAQAEGPWKVLQQVKGDKCDEEKVLKGQKGAYDDSIK